jgi:orotate phosphoribosyltransferase
MTKNEIATKVAKYLLEVQAVKLSPLKPFTWTSGMLSPIYCDNRVTLSYPEARTFIRNSFAALIKENFADVDCIAGIATAGIAQGALIADILELPYIYIRPEPKKHGMKNSVEGFMKEGAKVVLIEDLVSTGKSSLAAIQNLRNSGGNAIGLVSIFTYGFPQSAESFQNANCPFISLCSYEIMLEMALSIGYINENEKVELENWRQNPQVWAANFS